MPRKRKVVKPPVAPPVEMNVEETAKEEVQDEIPEQPQLRDIGNIVMKSKTGLFSSNIFCRKLLDVMTEELVQDATPAKERCSPRVPSKRRKSGRISKRALATSILLEDSSCDEEELSQLEASYSSDLPTEPVQSTSHTLEMLEDLETLKSESYVVSDDDSLSDVLCLDDLPDITKVMIQLGKKLINYTMNTDEKFETIFERLSQKLGVKPSQILLTLRGGTVRMQDTPASLGMTIRDTLVCIVRKLESSVTPVPVSQEDLISLRFQCDNKRIHHTISIGKSQRLLEALKLFAEKTSLDLSKMVMKFDGDRVDPEESSDDLGMESGDCIDVVMRS